MAEQFLLPQTPRLPAQMPQSPGELTVWTAQIQEAIRVLHLVLVERLQTLITVGVIADRPAATGTLIFYFSTDEAPPTLYLDNGVWNAI